MPDSVTELGLTAFQNCTSLTDVSLSAGLKELHNEYYWDDQMGWSWWYIGIFEDCTNLTTVVIPDSIENIDGNTFMNCNNLKTIYYTGSEEQWKNVRIANDTMFDDETDDYIEVENEALKNAEIIFNYVDPNKSKPGDMNGDNTVDNKDVVTLFRYASGNAGYDAVYDYNNDNEVNNKDVVELFRFVSAAQ